MTPNDKPERSLRDTVRDGEQRADIPFEGSITYVILKLVMTGSTVTVQVAVLPLWVVAVIVVVPVPLAVMVIAVPLEELEELTVATLVLLLSQVTVLSAAVSGATVAVSL